MEPFSSYLTLLADQILIPAATLSELPDLNIEPAKVHQLILDYVFDQDCPGALASLQRELTRATRRQHLNHGSSRIVQLISKGLVYEKNRPRLDLILKGCDAIMKALEKLPSVSDQTPHASSSKPQAMALQAVHVPISRAHQIPAISIPNPSVPRPAPTSLDHKHSQSLPPNQPSLATRSTLNLPLHSHPTLSLQPPARPTPIIHHPSHSPQPVQRPNNEPSLNLLCPNSCPTDPLPHSLATGNSLQLTNQPDLNSPSPLTHLPGPSSKPAHDRSSSVRPGSSLPNKPVQPPTNRHTSRPPSPRTHPRISISIHNPVITPKPLEKASWPSVNPSQQAIQQDPHSSEEPVQSTSSARFPIPEESLSLGMSEWRTIGDSDEIMYLASVGPSPSSIPVFIDENEEYSPRWSRSSVLEQAIKLEEPDETQTVFNELGTVESKKRSHPIFRQNIDPQLAALEDHPTSSRKKARLAPLGSPHVSPSYSDNMVLETPTLPSWPRGSSVLQPQEGELMMPGTPPELMSPYLDGCPITEDGLTKSENEFGGGEAGATGDGGAAKGKEQRSSPVSEAGSLVRMGGCTREAKSEGERRREMSDAQSPPSRRSASRNEPIETREPAVRKDSLVGVLQPSDVAEVRVAVGARQEADKASDDQACKTVGGKQAPRLEPEAGSIGTLAERLATRIQSTRTGEDGAQIGHATDHMNSEPAGSVSGTVTGTGGMTGLDPAKLASEVDCSIEATHTPDLIPEPIGSAAGPGTGKLAPNPAEPARAVDSPTEAAHTPDLNPEPFGTGADEPSEPGGQPSSTRPSSASTLSTLEELRAKLIASRNGRLKTGSPSLGPSSGPSGPSGAVQVLEQNLRAQLKFRRAGSPGSQKGIVGGGPQAEDMEDGQITTPPPGELRDAEQSKPFDAVALPTVHPLPSKPDFPPVVAPAWTYKTGAFGGGLGAQRAGGRGCGPMAPPGCPIPGLSVGNPSFGQKMPGPFGALGMGGPGMMKPAELGSQAGGWAGQSEPPTMAGGGEAWRKPESDEAGVAGHARLTPRLPDQPAFPGSSFNPLPSCSSSSNTTLNPAPIRLACTSSAAHPQAERKTKEHSPSDSLQLAALREREAVLAAELIKKRMDLKIALGGPVGGGAKTKGKGVCCSTSSNSSSTGGSGLSGGGGGAGEQEKESGLKASRIAFDWAKRLERPNAIETCSPAKKGNIEAESVEEFLTDLEKQIGGREGSGGSGVGVGEGELGEGEGEVVKDGRAGRLEVDRKVILVVRQGECIDRNESEEEQNWQVKKEKGRENIQEGIFKQEGCIVDEEGGDNKKKGDDVKTEEGEAGGGNSGEVGLVEGDSKEESTKPNGVHGLSANTGLSCSTLDINHTSQTSGGPDDRTVRCGTPARSESPGSVSGSESSLEIFVGEKKVLVSGGGRFL